MIARLWFGSTRDEDADAYVDYLEQTGVAAHRETPGNKGSLVLRRRRGGRDQSFALDFGVFNVPFPGAGGSQASGGTDGSGRLGACERRARL